MSVKTIVGAVLAVAVGGSVLGFVSQYRSNCCSDEANKNIGLTATTSKNSMVSQEVECQGSCDQCVASGGKVCCQSSKGHEGECHGDCALGDSASGKKCCQDAATASDNVDSPK